MTIRRRNILSANVHYRCVANLQLSVQRFVFMWAKRSRGRHIKQRAKQTNIITMLSIEVLFPMKIKHIFLCQLSNVCKNANSLILHVWNNLNGYKIVGENLNFWNVLNAKELIFNAGQDVLLFRKKEGVLFINLFRISSRQTFVYFKWCIWGKKEHWLNMATYLYLRY